MLVEQSLEKGEFLKIRLEDKVEEFWVIKSYPHHVLCENRKGVKRCITNADLMMRGLVHQRVECYEKKVGNAGRRWGGNNFDTRSHA